MTKPRSGAFKLNLVSLGFTLGGLAFFILVLNVVIGVPLILNLLPLEPRGNLLVAVVPPIVLFAVAIFVIAVLYRCGPSRTQPQWRWVTPGSVVAAAVWVIGSALFSWYVANFANYSATYGSVGAIIGALPLRLEHQKAPLTAGRRTHALSACSCTGTFPPTSGLRPYPWQRRLTHGR